jgi:hypothetical protein
MHDPENFERLLDRVRLGSIVSPERIARSPNSPSARPALDGHAVALPAPAWLLGTLAAEDGRGLYHRFTVYPTDHDREYIVVITLQHGHAQLSCLLPMSDAGVKAFLTDSIERRSLQLMLMHEDLEHFSVLRLDTPFHRPQQLQELMNQARPHSMGIQALTTITLGLASARPMTSLIPDQTIGEVLVVLAGSEVGEAMQAAFGADAVQRRRSGRH